MMKALLALLPIGFFLSGCAPAASGLFGAGYQKGDFRVRPGYSIREHVKVLSEKEIRQLEALPWTGAVPEQGAFAYTVISGYHSRPVRRPGRAVYLYLRGQIAAEPYRLALRLTGNRVAEVVPMELPLSPEERRMVEAAAEKLSGLEPESCRGGNRTQSGSLAWRLHSEACLALALALVTDIEKALH